MLQMQKYVVGNLNIYLIAFNSIPQIAKQMKKLK